MKQNLLARPGWLAAAGVCFALAVFVRCALVGYGTMALLVIGLGAVILLYRLTPKWFRVALTIVLAAG
ncbi:MAG: hypothetical protein IJG08_08495, partial [Oscillospiraceae bacterium]|nr:hypothetical protein [Oscillospiraceae bacterium]